MSRRPTEEEVEAALKYPGLPRIQIYLLQHPGERYPMGAYLRPSSALADLDPDEKGGMSCAGMNGSEALRRVKWEGNTVCFEGHPNWLKHIQQGAVGFYPECVRSLWSSGIAGKGEFGGFEVLPNNLFHPSGELSPMWPNSFNYRREDYRYE